MFTDAAVEKLRDYYPHIVRVARTYGDVFGGARKQSYGYQESKVANLVIIERLGELDCRQIHLYLCKEDADQPVNDLGISVFDFTKGVESLRENISYLSIQPKGEEDLKINVYKPIEGINYLDVFLKAKQGVELFDALQKIPVSHRAQFKARVYDWLSEGFPQSPINKMISNGLVVDNFPEDYYCYMRWVLRREPKVDQIRLVA